MKATITILQYETFWKGRKAHFFNYLGDAGPEIQQQILDNDSDIDSINENDIDDDSDDDSIVQPDTQQGWNLNTKHEGVDVKSLYDETFAKYGTRSGPGLRSGLQCAINSVNSPLKAWKIIFTKLVFFSHGYTNFL